MGFDQFCELWFPSWTMSVTASCLLAHRGNKTRRLCSAVWAASPPLTISPSSGLTPLALRNKVTTEQQKLSDAGIIKCVNSFPWISNLVLARKKSGGLRPCVDLAINKAVIPDKYLLPTVEELHRLHSSIAPLSSKSSTFTKAGSATPRQPRPHSFRDTRRCVPLHLYAIQPQLDAQLLSENHDHHLRWHTGRGRLPRRYRGPWCNAGCPRRAPSEGVGCPNQTHSHVE